MKLVDDVLSGERMLVLVASRDPELEEPGPEQLYDVGVVGVVARMLKVPDGTMRILVQATERVRIGDYVAEEPYLVARIEALPDEVEPSPELEALTRNVQRTFSEIIEQIPYLPEELQLAVTNIDEPSALSHLIAGALRIPTAEKQELLEEVDVTRRLRRLSEILARELEVIQLGSRIQSEVESEMEKGQREYYLREQLKAIQRELGEEDETQAEVNELRERIEAADLPEHARKAADRELARLERLPSAAAEYGVIRTYLEWLVELPWPSATEDDLDIEHAREVLDADHYDLEKVKDRILEYLAVRQPEPGVARPDPLLRRPARRRQDEPRPVDRPGARARVRADLGRRRPRRGRDPRPPAHLHRRDAGTIVRALRDAGSRNPVFMIDEIDKMGADFRGDPSSAMLEVLDPAQNDSFRDHYLDLAVRPLRGAVHRDGEHARHDPAAAARPDGGDPARRLHDRREAPHRQALPRPAPARRERPQARRGSASPTPRCGRSSRSTPARPGSATSSARSAPSAASSRARSPRAKRARAADDLGEAGPRAARPAPVLLREAAAHARIPGVATGLAWTPVGGEVLFIEATAMPGSGGLTITGQLGDVMRESAQAALSWVRGHRDDSRPSSPTTGSRARHPHPRPRRRGARRTVPRPGRDGGGALVAGRRAAGLAATSR